MGKINLDGVGNCHYCIIENSFTSNYLLTNAPDFVQMNHNNLIGANLRRTLMLSPGQQETPPNNVGLASRSRREKEFDREKTDQTFMKVSFERYISQVLTSSEIEAHEQRLKKITEEAKNLSKDEWMFTPIEKLLGN